MQKRGARTWALMALSAIAVAGFAPAAQPVRTGLFVVDPLVSPAGAADSASPQLTVSHDRVILSWLERSGQRSTLKFAERTPSGWSAVGTVVSSETLIANWADVPSVRALGDGQLLAHWLEKNSPDPEAYDLRLSMSSNHGKTWTPPASPHRDQTKTQHGFASFFEAGPGRLGLIWLDGRETVKAGGAMTLRATEYSWGPASAGPGLAARGEVRQQPDPAGGEFTATESIVAGRVCDCCPTAAASTPDGAIVAFRNRTADEIRDIYVSRFDGKRWMAPAPVHNDGWKIAGCPVNGPALTSRGRDVAIGWFTAAGGAGKALAAFSRDAGRTFGSPVRIDDNGSTGRVQIALLKDGDAAVSWVEFSKGPSQLMVRRVGKTGTRSPPAAIADGLGTQFPQMAASRDELVFAWTENSRGSSRVRTARAKM